MAQGPYLRKYGVQTTVLFDLFEVDAIDFRVNAVHAAGDTKIMKDEAAEANTANGFTDEGQGYSIVLSATEMQAARIVVYVVDQTATKVWLDTGIVIETYGHASAMHAFDLDTALPANFSDLAIEATNGRVDIGNWLGTAPNALIAGRPDVNLGASQANSVAVGAIAPNAIDTIALAADAANEIRDAVWNHLELAIATAGSIGLKLKNTLPTTIIKNTPLNNFPFVMFDSTDHVTPKTGLTVTATRSINGGAFAAAANAVVQIGNGAYKINLAASDLNGDTIILRFAATGADDRLISIVTQKAAA